MQRYEKYPAIPRRGNRLLEKALELEIQQMGLTEHVDELLRRILEIAVLQYVETTFHLGTFDIQGDCDGLLLRTTGLA